MHRTQKPVKTRNHVARAAHMRNSAGAMGGGKREKNKRERQSWRQEAKDYR